MPPSQVNILSYNTFLRWPFISHNCRHGGHDYKQERGRCIAEEIAAYDIVLFQELWLSLAGVLRSKHRHRMLAAARAHGFAFKALPRPPNCFQGKFTDSGCVIVSKYPIVATDAIIFSGGNRVDKFSAKGVVYACVQLPCGMRLHVFNTHLQASYDEGHAEVHVRRSQLQHLRQFVDAKAPGSRDRIVIGGDFNINSYAKDASIDEYVHMVANPMDGFAPAIAEPEPTIEEFLRMDSHEEHATHCPKVCKECLANHDQEMEKHQLKRVQKCLDHIFTRNVQVEHAQVKDFHRELETGQKVFLSDHAAVEARIVV